MSEMLTGLKLANMICDDQEFFNAWFLGEITPFFKGTPQSYESSCVNCALASDNGQPSPFVCDTDPDPDTYPEVVSGCSRHSACAFSPLDDVARIVDRLKCLSFRSKEVELYFNETKTIPAIIAETWEETLKLMNKTRFEKDGRELSKKDIEILQCYHVWSGNKYKRWGKSQEEIVSEMTEKEGEAAIKWFQRRIKPLLD